MENKKELEMEDVPQNTWDTVKKLFSRLARQKTKLIIIALATLLSSISYAMIPLFLGMAVDHIVQIMRSGEGDVLKQVMQALSQPVLFIILASVVSSLLSYLQQYIVASVGESLSLSLRKDISIKLNHLPLRYFDAHQTGDIMSRMTNDVDKVSTVIQVGLMQFISSVFTLLLTCGMMIFLSPILFIITLVSLIACSIATRYVSRWSQICNAKNMQVMGELSSKVEETYTGNRIIKVFSQQEIILDELSALNKSQYLANRRAQFADFAIYPSIRFLNQLGFLSVAVIGGGMALSGGLTLGAVQAFLQYFNQISEPITQMSYVITATQAAIAGAERVFALLEEEEEVADIQEFDGQLKEGQVNFSDVRFGYVPERTLIKQLNLTVHPNEMVAIVGPTGGGKTTLINLLMRFYELNSGTITIDGHDIAKMPRSLLRRNIGMVLQDTWLFEGTVAENIAYGKMDASRQEIIAVAKAASCDHFIRTLPHGYDTMISGELSQLSQGQIQLLTIARAMLTNPSILILDEATSSVDTRTEVEIQKAMIRLMKDKTSFVIAHRLSTIRNADMILVVRDGDIIERGNHDTLLKQDGFYASLYNSQFSQ